MLTMNLKLSVLLITETVTVMNDYIEVVVYCFKGPVEKWAGENAVGPGAHFGREHE